MLCLVLFVSLLVMTTDTNAKRITHNGLYNSQIRIDHTIKKVCDDIKSLTGQQAPLSEQSSRETKSPEWLELVVPQYPTYFMLLQCSACLMYMYTLSGK
uniref:Putative secreted protein n=1 Tax=Amblyomma cajennense TaxID=34607 RepID=A0A023FDP4_AMBCJ